MRPGSGIVYCATRKTVDAVTSLLSANLKDRPIFAYHAGMDTAARTANQERFMQTPRAIAVATNAFGMGINKPDIRLVVHYNLPGTLEAYYQEAGRAGRDGRPARCMILFSYQDRYTQEFFIDKIGEDTPDADAGVIAERKDHAKQKLDLMIRYAQTHRCRRQLILDYFGDEQEVSDCQCDVCRRGKEPLAEAPRRRTGVRRKRHARAADCCRRSRGCAGSSASASSPRCSPAAKTKKRSGGGSSNFRCLAC